MIEAAAMNFYYGEKRALQDISIRIQPNLVTAFIGPSGCGKSTFLRTLNRMNDIIPGTRVEGRVLIDGANIYEPGVDVVALRRKVGMVFQKSNPFPKSIFENVAYGLRINGMAGPASELAGRVEESLKQAARVSDHTAFFWLGRLVEYDRTEKIFTNPAETLTEGYVTGRFG